MGPDWLADPGGCYSVRMQRTARMSGVGSPASMTRSMLSPARMKVSSSSPRGCGVLRPWPGLRARGLQSEAKVITGVDDHSRYCVICQVVPRATGRAVCLAFARALREFGVPAEVLTDIQAE